MLWTWQCERPECKATFEVAAGAVPPLEHKPPSVTWPGFAPPVCPGALYHIGTSKKPRCPTT